MKNTLCPHCGFDFETLKPSEGLQTCPCGKSYADVSIGLIRILFDEKDVRLSDVLPKYKVKLLDLKKGKF